MRRLEEGDGGPVVVVERGGGSVGAFVWGALLGAVAGLLLAPRSGAETRQLIRRRGQQLAEAAEDTAEDLRERLSTGYERTKEEIEERFEQARRTIDQKREVARDTVDAGRAAVHSAREELERRLADARAQRTRPRQTDDEPEA